MSLRNPYAIAALGMAVATLSSACTNGPSKDQAKEFVALSLSADTELHLAAFTGTFCESDAGRRVRVQGSADGAVPSNAYAFGRMADNRLLNTLITNGYIEVTQETLAPDEGETRHVSCGNRDVCPGCPPVLRYYVATYRLTPKGRDLFVVTPITEEDFVSLYNTGPLNVPLEDAEQSLGDEVPQGIFVTVATKTFDVRRVTTHSAGQAASIDYEWYWKPTPRVEKTVLKQMIPQGRNRATVSLKQMEDGWHLERDAAPMSQ